jgi:Na+/phosphate symporter
MRNLASYLKLASEIYNNSIDGFSKGEIELLKEQNNKLKSLKKNANLIVAELLNLVKKFPEKNKKAGRRFGKMIANIQQLSYHVKDLKHKSFTHIDNNHSLPLGEQLHELKLLKELVQTRFEDTIKIFESENFDNYQKYSQDQEEFNEMISTFDENQLNRISEGKDTAKNSMLFLEILSESESILAHLNSMVILLKKNHDKYTVKLDS